MSRVRHGSRQHRTGRRPTAFDRPRFLWLVTGLTLIFLFLPIAVVVVYSFNAGDSLVNFEGASLRWYRTLFTDGEMLASLWLSLRVALIASLASVVLGTMLAFGIHRRRGRIGQVNQVSVVLRVVTPETATGVALLLMFTQLGMTLNTTTLVLSHIALCIAFVTVIVQSRLALLNPEIEEAAMDLGATRLQAMWLVALPMLRPAIVASGLLAFVLSFDNFITSFFTSGIGVPPLPVRIYSMIRFGVTPEINAAGVLMLIVTVVAIGLAAALARVLRGGRRFLDGSEVRARARS